MANTRYTGHVIVIAWPETLCKQAGAWYDGLMKLFKISKNNYYKVGHAAVVLIESSTSKCFYFDFGRYHAPFGHGRVRDEITDHDLKIKTKPQISGNKLLNKEEILSELINNPSCHGIGFLYASTSEINFEKAYQKAKKMQSLGAIKYGPFVYKGTNCSRFVRSVVVAGKPKLKHQMKIKLPYTLSPTPATNVNALNQPIKLTI